MARFRYSLLAVAIAFAATTSAVAQPATLTLGTASVGGTYFVYGGLVADLLTEKADLPVTTRQTQGPNQNVILVDEGRLSLGMTTMGVALQAVTGSGTWTKGKKFENIRALFPMYDTPLQCVSLRKSGITSFRQLEGKTVGTGPKAGTAGTYYPLIFDALGMKAMIRNGQGAEMGNQLDDGIVDAFCFGAGPPVPIFRQLDTEKDVVFYTWTDDDIATIRSKIPEFSPSLIPKGLYRDQTADQRTVGLYNFAIANKDMANDTAYIITKTVLENTARLAKGHPAARETIAANAARYYKEKGIKLDPAALAK